MKHYTKMIVLSSSKSGIITLCYCIKLTNNYLLVEYIKDGMSSDHITINDTWSYPVPKTNISFLKASDTLYKNINDLMIASIVEICSLVVIG